MLAALGHEKHVCPNCNHNVTVQKDLPDEVWSYILRRHAMLTEDQRKLINQWDSGRLGGQRLMELLLRLDRTDALVAQSVVANQGKTAYFTEGGGGIVGLGVSASIGNPFGSPT